MAGMSALDQGGWKVMVMLSNVGGFREEFQFSLVASRASFQKENLWIPPELIWIMDDPGGNVICLGITGEYRNRIYFWDHERAPSPGEWDGGMETAGNLLLLAHTFSEFVAGLEDRDDEGFAI